MRHYTYNEYDPEHPLADLSGCYVKTVSEQDVREKYWPYWYQAMCAVYGQETQYDFEDCLQDWIVINWAWLVNESKKT